MPRWSAFSRRISPRAADGRAVDDPLVAPERAVEAAPRVLPEVGVLVDAGRDRRVRELEQERPRARAEQQHRLAIELPRLRSGPEHPDGLGLRIHAGTISREPRRTPMGRWGTDFEPDRLADLETRMWKAYYRRQPIRLFALLVFVLREQARVSWWRAVRASLLLTRAAAGFARAGRDYERFAPEHRAGPTDSWGCPDRWTRTRSAGGSCYWWVVRREIGVAAGEAAGAAITDLYAAIYELPAERVAEAGRLRGLAAEVRDRGAAADPEGARGAGSAYWPEVAGLLAASYRRLRTDSMARPRGDGRVAALSDRPAGGR